MPSNPREEKTPRWISEAAAAAMVGEARQSWANRRSLGRGDQLPPQYLFGRRVRYRADEVVAWAMARRVAR